MKKLSTKIENGGGKQKIKDLKKNLLDVALRHNWFDTFKLYKVGLVNLICIKNIFEE